MSMETLAKHLTELTRINNTPEKRVENLFNELALTNFSETCIKAATIGSNDIVVKVPGALNFVIIDQMSEVSQKLYGFTLNDCGYDPETDQTRLAVRWPTGEEE